MFIFDRCAPMCHADVCDPGYFCTLGSPTAQPDFNKAPIYTLDAITYGGVCPRGGYCPAGSWEPRTYDWGW